MFLIVIETVQREWSAEREGEREGRERGEGERGGEGEGEGEGGGEGGERYNRVRVKPLTEDIADLLTCWKI